jgi:hypothetical protein
MATNRRFGKKLPEWARREDTPGVRIDSGPFIGYVKNNYDPLKAGRLQVWIPELGGDEETPSSWRTVSYASPYGGTTYKPIKDGGRNNEFSQVPHSYGMWGVPPDVNCQVICTFITGDPNRGYWFACINTDLSHYMLPGLAAGPVDTTNMTDEAMKAKYSSESNWPVAEFNELAPSANIGPGFDKNLKPPHEPQAAILMDQGLDRDTVRGAVTSSSQRESPSQVFGISTPGRPGNDPADDPQFKAKMAAGTLTLDDITVKTRKGGHTFIMDDGDQDGNSQLVRLRTAGGHQILMHDTEDVLYIANSTGTAWLEFTGGGHINVYSQQGINMRTEGEFNLHADKDINLNSGASVNINASSSIAQQTAKHTTKSTSIAMQASSIGILSSGEMKIQGASGSFKTSSDLVLKGGKIYLNTQTPADVAAVPALASNSHTDTSAEASGLWVSKSAVFDSIVTVAPSHEPWPRQSAATSKAAGSSLFTVPVPVTKQSSTCANDSKLTDPGPVSAKGQQVSPAAPLSEMSAAAVPHVQSLGRLSALQAKALMVQIGYAESGSDFTKTTSTRVGKYQINGKLLKQYGYVTDAANINSTLSWAGTEGIKSVTDWTTHTGTQDVVMAQIINDYYTELLNQNAIVANDDICTVAGMISVAYYYRDEDEPVRKALAWRKEGGAGAAAYNWGRYAIDVLAMQVVAAATPVVPASPSTSGIGPESVINFTANSGDKAHYEMLAGPMKAAFENMAKEFKAKTGRKVTLSSAKRTLEEQTALYNAWLAGNKHVLKPAKPSPNAPHIRGIAFDIARADLQYLLSTGLLDKYGFNFPLAYDVVHIQYKG